MRLWLSMLLALSLQAQSLDYSPPEDPDKVLMLPPEAREYFAKYVSEACNVETKVTELLQALLDPDKFGFTYEGHGFYDVSETFKRRRGNCQSFSMLLAGLCRAFDIPARFNHVSFYTHSWNRIGNVIIEIDHVNVRVDSIQNAIVLDIAPFFGTISFVQSVRQMPDAEMVSMFYSDVGVMCFARGQKDEAIHWLEKAVEQSPVPSSLRNLAVGYGGVSRLEDAERIARKAYSIDRHDARGASLLASILKKQGKLKESASFAKKAQKYELQNPYYHYYKAMSAFSSKNFPEAYKAVGKAIRIKSDEVQFWRLKRELLLMENESTASVDRKIRQLQEK